MLIRLKNIFHKPRNPLPWSGLSLQAWRASDARTEYVRNLVRAPMFASLLGVLQNSMPMPRQGSAAFDAGVVQGYMLCLNNLMLAAEPGEKAAVEVPETYDRPMEDLIPTGDE